MMWHYEKQLTCDVTKNIKLVFAKYIVSMDLNGDLVSCQVLIYRNKRHNTCWNHCSLQGLEMNLFSVSVTTWQSCCSLPELFHTSTVSDHRGSERYLSLHSALSPDKSAQNCRTT